MLADRNRMRKRRADESAGDYKFDFGTSHMVYDDESIGMFSSKNVLKAELRKYVLHFTITGMPPNHAFLVISSPDGSEALLVTGDINYGLPLQNPVLQNNFLWEFIPPQAKLGIITVGNVGNFSGTVTMRNQNEHGEILAVFNYEFIS